MIPFDRQQEGAKIGFGIGIVVWVGSSTVLVALRTHGEVCDGGKTDLDDFLSCPPSAGPCNVQFPNQAATQDAVYSPCVEWGEDRRWEE